LQASNLRKEAALLQYFLLLSCYDDSRDISIRALVCQVVGPPPLGGRAGYGLWDVAMVHSYADFPSERRMEGGFFDGGYIRQRFPGEILAVVNIVVPSGLDARVGVVEADDCHIGSGVEKDILPRNCRLLEAQLGDDQLSFQDLQGKFSSFFSRSSLSAHLSRSWYGFTIIITYHILFKKSINSIN